MSVNGESSSRPAQLSATSITRDQKGRLSLKGERERERMIAPLKKTLRRRGSAESRGGLARARLSAS